MHDPTMIRTPPGTGDQWPDEAEAVLALETRLMTLWRARGYRRVNVPTYEDVELYARLYGDDVRQRLITFTTDREYALRPDLTAGICRLAVTGLGQAHTPATPLRLAASGQAFRHERIRPLRQRAFHQTGLERLGDRPQHHAAADVELLSLARLALQEAALDGGLLRVGHARLRAEVLDSLGGDPTLRARLSALLDQLARLKDRLEPPRTGVDLPLNPETSQQRRIPPLDHPDAPALLEEIRLALRNVAPTLSLDTLEQAPAALERALLETTRALGASDAATQTILRLSESAASLDELADTVAPLLPNARARLDEALGHIEACHEDLTPLVLRFGLGATRWSGFYTGFFFEIDAPVLGPDVSQVLGGGRYDDVLSKLSGAPSSSCGFALGMERCLAAARLLHGPSVVRRRLIPREPLLILIGSRDEDTERALALAERLGRRGASVAFHPAALPDFDPEQGPPEALAAGLKDLPGTPYRQALLVNDALHILDIATSTVMPITPEELALMF